MKSQSAFTTIHPGDVLREELDARGIKQKDFASTISMPASVLNDIVKGKRSVTPDIAILLEAALGKDASSWLRLQAERDLEVARKKEEFIQKQKDIETWQSIQSCCNVKYLEKYISGGLGKTIQDKIHAVLNFFNVKTADALRQAFVKDVDPAYFRKSDKFKYDPVNIFTWKYMAFNKCDSVDRPKKFTTDSLNCLIEGLQTILYENEDTMNRIAQLLREYGIRFFTLDNEKGTYIDGFSFWKGSYPAIALTLDTRRLTYWHSLSCMRLDTYSITSVQMRNLRIASHLATSRITLKNRNLICLPTTSSYQQKNGNYLKNVIEMSIHMLYQLN